MNLSWTKVRVCPCGGIRFERVYFFQIPVNLPVIAPNAEAPVINPRHEYQCIDCGTVLDLNAPAETGREVSCFE